MPTTSIRRIFIIAGVISLFISYMGIWIRLINDPVERTGSDFISYYSVGRIAQTRGAAHIYDPLLQQEFQEKEVGFELVPGQVLLYYHPPFLTPLLQLVVSADYVNSFYRWIALLIAIYLCSMLVLSRVLMSAGIDGKSVLLAASGGLLFLPLFFSLMNGQDTAILLLGASLWVFGLLSGKDVISGLGLSLLNVRPHIALILALPMLFYRRKVFLGFLLGSFLLALFSVVLVGIDGTYEYINILFISAGGKWYGIQQNAMFNLMGLLLRLLPGLNAQTIRVLAWVVYGIAIVYLCILWARSKNLQAGLIGLSVTLALFAVPHLHFHDLTLLLIPIYELIRVSKETGNLKTSIAITIPIAISLLLLISNISYYLQYTTPYLIMLILIVYPFYQRFEMPVRASQLVNK